MLAWFGTSVRSLFSSFGWMPALIVIVVLALLATGIVWFLGIDVAGLWGG